MGREPTSVIPIFPLGHVLLPGMPLPLHIFEARYRQLLADVTAPSASRSFGIVVLTRGSEVGTHGVAAEPQFAEVGTVAEIIEIEPYDDGASDLLAMGSRRFRIVGLVAGKPYLQAEVVFLEEHDGELQADLRDVVDGLEQQHARLIFALTGRRAPAEPAVDAIRFSYRLAAHLPLTPLDRQALLEQPTAAARLRRTAVLLRREIALLQATRTIAVSPGVLQLYVRPN